MTDRFLPYGRQSIGEDDIAAVIDVLQSDFLTTGPAVPAMEDALSARIDARFTCVCNSGTAALHLAAMALDTGPGDCVIVPSMTFLASANAFAFCGATIIFADIDPETGLMRPEDLEEAITRATITGGKLHAVVAVHYSGHVCDMPAIAAIARRHGMTVIEDACHALDSRHGPGLTAKSGDCRWSDMTCFSFHPVKTIAMGEGGAVTCKDPVLAEKLKRLRNHGMSRDENQFSEDDLGRDSSGDWGQWYYEMNQPGYNYRASDIQAALGLSQVNKLDGFSARRRSLRAAYYARENDLPAGMRWLKPATDCDPCPHLQVALFDNDFFGLGRNGIMQALRDAGIGSQVHYIPVHRQPYYRRMETAVTLPGADRFYECCLSLPLYPAMEDGDPDRVIAALQHIAGQ